MNSKRKKIVLLTGCSSGIGLCIAKAFAEKNYIVIACARRKNLICKEFEDFENVHPFEVDLSYTPGIKAFLDNISNKFGHIDILFNNAATLIRGKVEDISLEDWIKSYSTNVIAVFELTKGVLPEMKKRNFGRIINMSSGGSVNCSAEYSAYSSTKAAINAFTKSVANELVGTNIKINTMSPGPCKTAMFPENPLSPEAGVPTALMLSSEKEDLPSGKFFWMEQEIEIFPDVSHIDWSDPNSLNK